MGEYVKHIKNGSVKIGTCESLYYTSYQKMTTNLSMLQKQLGNDYPEAYLENNSGYRFRFPFPDEDNNEFGEVKDLDRHLTVCVPREYWDKLSIEKHDTKVFQFSDNGSHSIGVTIDCPYSRPPMIGDLVKPRQDGFFQLLNWDMFGKEYGIIGIVQQKFVDNELQTVVVCPYCEVRYRLLREDVVYLIKSIRLFHQDRQDGNYNYYMEICRRIIQGYQMKKQLKPIKQ